MNQRVDVVLPTGQSGDLRSLNVFRRLRVLGELGAAEALESLDGTAFAQNHVRDDALSAGGIGNTDNDGFTDLTGCVHDVRDFVRTDAEAHGLDHTVTPADVEEVSIRVAAGHVAGKDDALRDRRTFGREGIRTERAGSGVGIAPVAERDRGTAMHDFADFTVRDRAAVLVEEQDVGIRHRDAHGAGADVDLVGRQVRAPKRLGHAVLQEETGIGHGGAHAFDELGREVSPRVLRDANTPERAVYEVRNCEQLTPQRWHRGDDTDVQRGQALHQVIRNRGTLDCNAGTDRDRGQHLVDAVNGAERQQGGNAIFSAQAEVSADRLDARVERAVAEANPLRQPRRAGRVDDLRRIRADATHGFEVRDSRSYGDVDHRGGDVEITMQTIEHRLRGQQQRRTRVIDDVLDLSRPIPLVYDDGDRTDGVRTEYRCNGIGAALEEDRYTIARHDVVRS